MIPAAEAKVQRKLTFAFIEADSVQIALVPAEFVSNGSGGRKRVDLPVRPPQSMRLIPQDANAAERETLDGSVVQPNYMLLGVWDASMARGDRFTNSGTRYEVVYVHAKRDYQTKGEVITRGEA